MRTVGSIAGYGVNVGSAGLARSAYRVGNVQASNIQAASAGATPELAEQAPGGVAREQMARHASPVHALPYHGEPGSVVNISKETVEQIGAVNAYKSYMAVFRADNEIHSSLLKIKA